ncbi:hypothetical protein PAMP_023132 [Pampus punctatissimus]
MAAHQDLDTAKEKKMESCALTCIETAEAEQCSMMRAWSTVSDPVRPGDSVTLQCSVVSESQNEMCPGETSVYWYRAGSHASHPAFIYTDGNSRDICREKPGIHSSPKSCVYRFSKNVSSSDAGTYYCAVATCGDILFGNGTKVELGCTDHHIYDTKTVRVGEDVKLICTRDLSGTMFWIKLVSENMPQVLATTYDFEDRYSRITAKEEPGKFVLHIRNTELSDTAAYYCMKISQRKLIFFNGTFLKVEGSGTYTNITAVPPSDPVPTGDSVTLQCSVLSENKTCLEEDNVYWFSARLDKTQPSFIYTQGNSGEQSQKSLDTQSLQKCVSRFSRNNVSSSDAGTYYCAVATCGETLSRNGTKLNTEVAFDLNTDAAASGVQCSWQTDEDSLVYSAPTFTSKKSYKSGTKDTKTSEIETIYTDAGLQV